MHLVHRARRLACRGGRSVGVAFVLVMCGWVVGARPVCAQDASRAADGAPPTLSNAEQVRALQERSWEIRATNIQTPLRVDAVLDEPVWGDAEVIAEFYQRYQRTVLPASERTEIRLLYDDRFLYIGVRAFDSEPDKMAIKSIFRDESAKGDVINIVIDAYHGHRSAVQFSSNANGVMWDLLQVGETAATRDASFDVVWHSKGRRTPTGYEIEMAIPFTSLRFDSRPPGEETVFGIGFRRNIIRKNEEAIWPYVSNDSDWQRPAEYGHLRGLINVRPGRNLEIRPYVLGGTNRDLARAFSETRREAGLDVKWGMTTGLTADFSVNTDFAQEEADLQQVNFTRFSLFFPEKRQFFLEGEQTFRFGIARQADLTFTRRIGLSAAGEIVPIRAGARVSGRQGRTNLGLMNIQTERVGALPAQNFSVLRVKRDLFARSSIGAIVPTCRAGAASTACTAPMRVSSSSASGFSKASSPAWTRPTRSAAAPATDASRTAATGLARSTSSSASAKLSGRPSGSSGGRIAGSIQASCSSVPVRRRI